MRSRLFLTSLLFVVTAVLLTNQAVGQAAINFAQLNGTVEDPNGRVVVSASISLRNLDTNKVYTATSSSSGYYLMPGILPGRYELKIVSQGFAPYTRTGLVLTVGQSATVDVNLTVGAVKEVVEVTTQAPTIEPSRTEVSQVIATQQIESLPTSQRLFTDFALLTPGVATSRTSLGTTFTEYEATQISFGGMRSFSNEITVDGADFVNTISGVQRSTPPQDSVQEFRVVNNSFGSEYGRALGGIVNIVTKSGTNDFHGSIYNYFQNSALDGRSLLQPAPLPHELRQNQFGGTWGGPIKKDKAFFFLNYEGKRRGESPTYAPDLVNNIGAIDTAKAYLGLAPEGCVGALASCTGTSFGFLNRFLKTADNDYGFAKLDLKLNENNRLALRYNIEDARDLGELVGQTLDGGGIGVPSGGRNLFVRDQSLVGTLTSQFGTSRVNTVLTQWSRRHYNFPGATGQPDLSVVNDLEFGHNFGTYDAIYESRMQFSDSVAWVKGNHFWKFGADANYVWGYNNYPGFTPERIILPDLNCLVTFANFVDFGGGPALAPVPGAPCPLPPGADGVGFLFFGVALPRTGFTNGFVPPPATGSGFGGPWTSAFPSNLASNYAFTLNHGYWGGFAQDQWRVTHKLTVNYGLRYDLETGLGNFIDTDYRHGIQPRVGLAYSPDSKTVIRAGFGMFEDRQNLTFFFTTGNQKTLPGFLCNPASAAPGCLSTPIGLPMVQSGAANGGWQLNGLPGFPGLPANVTAAIAASILAGNPYLAQFLTGACPPACGNGAGGMDRHHTPNPSAAQISLEVDRQIGKGLTINAGYLFVGAHHLIRGNNINVPCPAGTSKPGNPADVQGWLNPNGTLSPCQGTPTLGPLGLGPFFATLANPSGLETLQAGLLDYNNGVANAAYHGGTLTVIEKAGNYFSLTANYTYSHTIDNGNFTTFINLPQNQFDYAAERANSNQDVRHHFVANFTAQAPKKTLLRNFEFSSIITAQSGRPFTLFSGLNTFGDVAGASTDRVGGAPVNGSCASVNNCSTTVGRNTYIGDGLYSWDLRLSRYFQLTEHKRLDLSMDVFNALNRANIDEVNSVYGSPVFCGAIPKSFNDAATIAIQHGLTSCAAQQAALAPPLFLAQGLLPVPVPPTPNPAFGTPRTVLNPRQFQFAARFSF
jgi:Carboxypeptidase regulatory-like domain